MTSRPTALRGVVYLNQPNQTDEQKGRDLDRIKATGFNTVTLWPVCNPWLADEPDAFVFAGTSRLMDLCHERGLKVILQLIGQNSAWEFMPDCRLEDDMLIEWDTLGERHNWANYSHPKVDALIHEYFTAAARSLGRHPALFAWEPFNEAHWRTDDPHTVKRFQDWLSDRYGDIKTLNRKWCRRFRDFSEVTIQNRAHVYSVWSSMLPEVDYNHFVSQELTRLVTRWSGFIREVDAEHPVFQDTAGQPFLGESMTSRNDNGFELARAGDFFGGSFYPKSYGQDLAERPWEMSLQVKLCHSAAEQAGKPFYVTELQTHTQSLLSPGSEVSPAQLRNWIWSSLLAGAKGYQLWKWRPFQSGFQVSGRGLTDLAGIPTARAEAVHELNRAMIRNEADMLAANPVKPAVKILLSYRSRLFFDLSMKKNDRKALHGDSVKGWYRLLWTLGLPAGFAEADQLCPDDLDTPFLIAPALISLTEQTMRQLVSYVENGGNLIVDGRFASLDDDGCLHPEGIPCPELARIVGCHEIEVGPETPFELNGEKVESHFMTQVFSPHPEAEVIARLATGEAVAVRNRTGRGSTLVFGSFLGATLADGLKPAHQSFFLEHFLSRMPEMPRIEKDEGIDAAIHESEDQILVYLLNGSSRSGRIKLHGIPVAGMGRDILDGSETDLTCQLAPDQMRILRFDRNPVSTQD